MRKRFHSITVFLLFLSTYMVSFAFSATPSNTTISAGDVVVFCEESIVVPIEITDNLGICGALVTIDFDGITLDEVTQGEALGTLHMSYSIKQDANSVVILWDGVRDDTSNGVAALLTFKASDEKLTSDINIHCKTGDIKDENLKNVNVDFTSGTVTVQKACRVKVTLKGKEAELVSKDFSGRIIVAYYEESGKYISMNMYSPDEMNISPTPPANADYAKVMWWDSGTLLKPICANETVYFN